LSCWVCCIEDTENLKIFLCSCSKNALEQRIKNIVAIIRTNAVLKAIMTAPETKEEKKIDGIQIWKSAGRKQATASVPVYQRYISLG